MKYITRSALVMLICSLQVSDVFARAGGGGAEVVVGGGIIVTILAFVLAPFFFIYSVITTFLLGSKKRRAKALAEKLNKDDRIWNMKTMLTRVEEVFFKVQKAWSERNQQIARSCMTDRIFEKHKMQTDEMIANKSRNVLERINLKEAMIFSVCDFKDNSLDTFSARIEGSMVDYHINETTGAVIAGDKFRQEDFKEIWTFVRDGDKWLLDEIDQKVTMGDMISGKAYTEQ